MEIATLVAHMPMITAMARERVDIREDIEDVVQDVCEKVLRFSRGTGINWLRVVTRNACTDFWRRHSKHQYNRDCRAKVCPVDGLVIELPDGEHVYLKEPSKHYEQDFEIDMLDKLEDAVNQLGESHRVPLVMYYLGFKYEDIAKHMDIPLGTVRSRIYYAKEQARKILEGL